MPDAMPNIYFNSDPDFPYSPEIEQAFLNLQDYGFLTRPNPSLRSFRFYRSSDISAETCAAIKKKWKEFIESFKKTLVIQNNLI